MEMLFLALGLVLIVEGLAWVLAPSLIERMLEMLSALPEAARRQVGALGPGHRFDPAVDRISAWRLIAAPRKPALWAAGGGMFCPGICPFCRSHPLEAVQQDLQPPNKTLHYVGNVVDYGDN